MKNVKIADEVHYEVSVFSAINKNNISDVVGIATMQYLQKHGHKFSALNEKIAKNLDKQKSKHIKL